MDRETPPARIKAALQSAHGGRLQGVVLYGSETGKTAREDSDIDVRGVEGVILATIPQGSM